MATLSYQQVKTTGTTVTFSAATSGGDAVKPNDRGLVLVKNGDSASHTVTVVTPGNDEYSQARPDVTVTVGASATAAIGPFPKDLADNNGLVQLTYSAVTSVTVAAVQV